LLLKDIGYGIGDLARTGLIIRKKRRERARADERDISPEMVSQMVDRLHPRRMRARVAEIFEETASTRTLRLVPVDGPFPPFRAGQFVNLFLTIDGVATSRPYSISSPPTRAGHIDITVRKMPDGFVSAYLCERAIVGDRFELSGPAGCSHHEPLTDTDRLVFLGGGCGITAFMSMIRSEADAMQGLDMHLIYGSRVPDDVIFHEELVELAGRLDNFRMDLVISEPPKGYRGLRGFLDAKTIGSLVDKLKERTFFLCGPLAMYELCTQALRELGVPDRRVKMELPGPPPDITSIEGWPKKIKRNAMVRVEIEGETEKIEAACAEPLLNSLERSGVALDALCRSGECGHCKVRLLQGDVFVPPMVTPKKADALFGYIHPCMAYPVGDVLIRL